MSFRSTLILIAILFLLGGFIFISEARKPKDTYIGPPEVWSVEEESIIGIDIENLKQTKLNEEEFQKFLRDDYIVFKTEIKTNEKKRTRLWGIILGIVAILSLVLQFIFKK